MIRVKFYLVNIFRVLSFYTVLKTNSLLVSGSQRL